MSRFEGIRCLLAYFSRKGLHYVGGKMVDLPVGNTEQVAKVIWKQTKAEAFAIKPVVPYPKDIRQTARLSQRELYADARPRLAHRVERMEEYPVVFLGYPNWWGTLPMPVAAFLEGYDFSGKILLPFCTHEGGGLGNSERAIASLCPGAKVLPGLAVAADGAAQPQEQVVGWLAQMEAALSFDGFEAFPVLDG